MSVREQAARIVRNEQLTADKTVARPNELASELASALPNELHPPGGAPVTPVAREPARPTVEPAVSPAGQTGEVVAKANGHRRKVLFGLLAIVALAVIGYGIYYTLVGRFRISTDDAYVRANNTTLGARVSGHIDSIAVADNSHVKPGDVIIRIDDGDYRLAVEAVRDKIATQEATIVRIGQQIAAQNSSVDQAHAQLDSAKAGAARAQADYDRQQALNDRGFASKAVLESSLAGRDQAEASVQNAQAAYTAALASVDVVKAQQAEAQRQLGELKTQLAKTERDLDFTQVRAPVEGVFSNRLVNAGDYVQPGQRLGNIVPLQGVYIDANFKETQLERLKPGQPVKISIDAFSTHKIDGAVESIAAASGAVFSLLPPDNATGNFTKIVQRVPVRIRVPTGVARARLLRPGMSVIVTVDTRNAPDDPSAPLDQAAEQPPQ